MKTFAIDCPSSGEQLTMLFIGLLNDPALNAFIRRNPEFIYVILRIGAINTETCYGPYGTASTIGFYNMFRIPTFDLSIQWNEACAYAGIIKQTHEDLIS